MSLCNTIKSLFRFRFGVFSQIVHINQSISFQQEISNHNQKARKFVTGIPTAHCQICEIRGYDVKRVTFDTYRTAESDVSGILMKTRINHSNVMRLESEQFDLPNERRSLRVMERKGYL